MFFDSRGVGANIPVIFVRHSNYEMAVAIALQPTTKIREIEKGGIQNNDMN